VREGLKTTPEGIEAINAFRRELSEAQQLRGKIAIRTLAWRGLSCHMRIEQCAMLLSPVVRQQLAQAAADRLKRAGVIELVEPFADPEPLVDLARAQPEDVGEQEDLPLAVGDGAHRFEQTAGRLEQLRLLGGVGGAVRDQGRLRRRIGVAVGRRRRSSSSQRVPSSPVGGRARRS
jgi:hypothetical protein